MRIFAYSILAAAIVALVVVLALPVHVQPLPVRSYAPMPHQLDVMGVEWRVEEAQLPPGYVGFTHCAEHVILVETAYFNLRKVLIHELLHAATCHYSEKSKDFEPANFWYNSKSEEEHEGFNNIAGVISELLVRNPQLAQWESEGGTISLGNVQIR